MKLKTHKGLAKRLRVTGSSSSPKLMHGTQFDNHHLKSKKSALKKNRMAGDRVLAKTDKTKTIVKWL